MQGLFELKKQRETALAKSESIVAAAENAKRTLTPAESVDLDMLNNEVSTLNAQIAPIERQNTILRYVDGKGRLIPGDANGEPGANLFAFPAPAPETRGREYSTALNGFLKTGGKVLTADLVAGADGTGGFYVPGSERFTRQRRANGSFQAATYEGTLGGSDSAGGYAVSVPTDQMIVPLAMPDLGIFDASMVIPTATDIKIPQAASLGTSALKAESTGTVATFGGTDPTLGQITLSSFMVGALRLASWELLQDVPAFQEFIVSDLLKGQRILEGQLLATGTGSSQPLGAFGNTGTGTGSAYELTGTASTDGALLLNSLFDVTSTLKGQYQAGACWIMSRATGLAIRKAQMQSNLFVPVATVDADGTERILGRPVYYDQNSPSLPAATSSGVVPILFGDFKQGYIVGVRGGAGINVKVLDQPYAVDGQVGLLAYRRLDGRVRRSESIQAIEFSHA
jgi:HK97 family phage major capsid protein